MCLLSTSSFPWSDPRTTLTYVLAPTGGGVFLMHVAAKFNDLLMAHCIHLLQVVVVGTLASLIAIAHVLYNATLHHSDPHSLCLNLCLWGFRLVRLKTLLIGG